MSTAEQTRQVIGDWVDGLAQAIEAMTEKRPETRWEAAGGTFAEAAAAAGIAEEAGIFWWEQPFQPFPDALAWVAAPRRLWEAAGTLILQSAGLEKVEQAEARNTWLEVLGQSLAAMARSAGAVLGREVTCEGGAEHPAPADLQEWAIVHVALAGDPPPLLMALGPRFAALLASRGGPQAAGAQESLPAPAFEANPSGRADQPARTMELLLDVELPISISFGKAQLPLKDVLKLTTGSIVELNCGANEPVEVLVNHCLIARGEVVVVEGNYGVRIHEIANRQDRLRSLR